MSSIIPFKFPSTYQFCYWCYDMSLSGQYLFVVVVNSTNEVVVVVDVTDEGAYISVVFAIIHVEDNIDSFLPRLAVIRGHSTAKEVHL